MHYTCFKCGRRTELDPVLVGVDLSKLKVKKPKYYQANCPACQATNKVSIVEMQAELDAAAEEIQAQAAELEKARAEAKAAKRAAVAAKRAERAKEAKSK